MAKKENCNYQVLLIPETGGPVRNLRLPLGVIRALIVISVLSVVLVATSVGLHAWNLERLHTMHELSQENLALRTHLQSVAASLARVENLVVEGERMEQQARLLAGLEPVDEEMKQMGVGGPLVGTAGSQTHNPALGEAIRNHNVRLQSVERRLAFQKQSFEETLDALEKVGDRLAHTPSISPLREHQMVASGYGWRKDPFTGEQAFHDGLDFPAPTGTDVHATAAGTVVFAGQRAQYGLTVRVRHGYGYETTFSHLERIGVRKGEKVERGDVLGDVGSTGRSTGPHLHYEVHVNGLTKDPSLYILKPRNRT